MENQKHDEYVKIKMFLETISDLIGSKPIDKSIRAEYEEVYNIVYKLVNPALTRPAGYGPKTGATR